MIDVSNLVVKAVKRAIQEEYPDIPIYSSYIDETERLPAITVYELENTIDTRTMDSCSGENYANVLYEISVYTETDGVGKQLAKDIFTRINDELVSINFVRVFKSELPNRDRKVFRYQGRFKARVSSDKERDGDIINYVYRR